MLLKLTLKIILMCSLLLPAKAATDTTISCIEKPEIHADLTIDSSKTKNSRKKKTMPKVSSQDLAIYTSLIAAMAAGGYGIKYIFGNQPDSKKLGPGAPANASTPIKLDQIFEHVTGFTESSRKQPKFISKDDGCYYIQNSQTGQEFCCGKIEYKTLEGWRRGPFPDPDDKTQASFKVICYTGNDTTRFPEADVCALQANPENADAVFQLASRFHGLEGGCLYGGEIRSPGLGFNRMRYGPTQGEYASFSAAPGTIYKIYGYEPINMLEDTPLKWFVDPMTSGGMLRNLRYVIQQGLQAEWQNNFRIYFHENIDVVAGASSAEVPAIRTLVSTPHKIHQVLVASFDYRYGRSQCFQPDEWATLYAITQQMLLAIYEGTLLATASHKKHKLFLTAVGGGAFMNQINDIINAIANGENLRIIRESKLDVTLVIHTNKDEYLTQQWREGMAFFRNKDQLVYEFNEI